MTPGQARDLVVRPNAVRTQVDNIPVKTGAGARRQAHVRVLGQDVGVVRRFGVTLPLAGDQRPAHVVGS